MYATTPHVTKSLLLMHLYMSAFENEECFCAWPAKHYQHLLPKDL